MNVKADFDIDVRDFDKVPQTELRKRIHALLMFILGTLGHALSEQEKKELAMIGKKISG